MGITVGAARLVAALVGVLGALPPEVHSQVPATGGRAVARSDGRQVLTPAAVEHWQKLVMEQSNLSPDGQWAAYLVGSYKREWEVVIRRVTNATEYRFVGGRQHSLHFLSPRFSTDSHFAVFSVTPVADSATAPLPATPSRAAPSSPELRIVALATGAVVAVPNVPAFTLIKSRPAVVAYTLGRPAAKNGARAASSGPGAPLILRTLETGVEVRLEDVASYVIDERGRWLVYAVSAGDPARDGVYARALTDGRTTTLLRGVGIYSGFVFDTSGTRLAFLGAPVGAPAGLAPAQAASSTRPAVYLARLATGAAARPVVPAAEPGDTLEVAANGELAFTPAGNALLFGVRRVSPGTTVTLAPTLAPPPPAPPAGGGAVLGSAPLVDSVNVELWDARAPYVPAARRQLTQSQRRESTTAIYWLDTGRWLRLGTDDVPRVRVNADASRGLVTTSAPYVVQGSWGDVRSDIYTVDPRTARRTLLHRAFGGPGMWLPALVRGDYILRHVDWSPAGKYLLLYERGRWSSQELATGRMVNLTGALPGRFGDEINSSPSDRGAWGIAGWTRGDEQVLIYDEFDIWAIDPSGMRHARNLTAGLGRRTGVRFRILGPNGQARYADYLARWDSTLDTTQPVLLLAEALETRETGFWRVRLDGTAPPTRLTMVPAQVRIVASTADGSRYLLTRQTYREYPDLWVTDRLEAPAYTRLTNINPQQAGYRWGTAELIRYQSTTGRRLTGVLYKPEDFDPTKKYPLLVSIYEEQSHRFHEYESPEPNVGALTAPAMYTSRGYLVLRPDIEYVLGRPCESAVAAVVPAVQALLKRGIVDPQRIGLAGHSFGGYETVCVISRTKLFRAAVAANGPVDLVSAYGHFTRNGSSNTALIEVGQGRLGTMPWNTPAVYIENSPIFHVHRITTPLLVLHSDGDDTVPWPQALELFAAMRRLGKEMYLVNYIGEGHQLFLRPPNVLDWDRRFHEFFGHYLMGGPRPGWMGPAVPEQVTRR